MTEGEGKPPVGGEQPSSKKVASNASSANDQLAVTASKPKKRVSKLKKKTKKVMVKKMVKKLIRVRRKKTTDGSTNGTTTLALSTNKKLSKTSPRPKVAIGDTKTIVKRERPRSSGKRSLKKESKSRSSSSVSRKRMKPEPKKPKVKHEQHMETVINTTGNNISLQYGEKDRKPGQKYPTPSPGQGTRVFYETLLVQRNDSKMALKWCTEHGVYPVFAAEKAAKMVEAMKHNLKHNLKHKSSPKRSQHKSTGKRKAKSHRRSRPAADGPVDSGLNSGVWEGASGREM